MFALFLIFPLFYAFGMSLFTTTLATGTQFTGIGNYVKAFTDPLFLEGLLRVLAFAVVMIPAQLIVALVAALVLDTLAHRGCRRLSRLFIFAPYAIPVVIGALMWSFLYSPRFGPAGTLFELVRPARAGLPRGRHGLLQPREHRHVAVVGLLHDRHLRGAALDRPVDLRGRPHRRRERAGRPRCASRSR